MFPFPHHLSTREENNRHFPPILTQSSDETTTGCEVKKEIPVRKGCKCPNLNCERDIQTDKQLLQSVWDLFFSLRSSRVLPNAVFLQLLFSLSFPPSPSHQVDRNCEQWVKKKKKKETKLKEKKPDRQSGMMRGSCVTHLSLFFSHTQTHKTRESATHETVSRRMRDTTSRQKKSNVKCN